MSLDRITDRHWLRSNSFPPLKVENSFLKVMNEIKYLGLLAYILTNDLNVNQDISREIHNMFVRTNVIKRKFFNCSLY